jgi:hypothetical protein
MPGAAGGGKRTASRNVTLTGVPEARRCAGTAAAERKTRASGRCPSHRRAAAGMPGRTRIGAGRDGRRPNVIGG